MSENTKNITNIKKIAIVLFYIMFLYSGVNKILNFNTKVDILGKKTNLPYVINSLGMIGVVLLEIIGSGIIILYSFNKIQKYKKLVQITYLLFLIFLVVVTILYHPPSKQKIIPFLSNLSHFSALLYLFADI